MPYLVISCHINRSLLLFLPIHTLYVILGDDDDRFRRCDVVVDDDDDDDDRFDRIVVDDGDDDDGIRCPEGV